MNTPINFFSKQISDSERGNRRQVIAASLNMVANEVYELNLSANAGLKTFGAPQGLTINVSQSDVTILVASSGQTIVVGNGYTTVELFGSDGDRLVFSSVTGGEVNFVITDFSIDPMVAGKFVPTIGYNTSIGAYEVEGIASSTIQSTSYMYAVNMYLASINTLQWDNVFVSDVFDALGNGSYATAGLVPLRTTPGQSIVGVVPSIGAFIYTATAIGSVVIAGGAVSSITLKRSGVTITLPGVAGMFLLSAGDEITVNNTVVPTMNFVVR